jgi:amino acid transporter
VVDPPERLRVARLAQPDDDGDARALEKLGYAQLLARRVGGFASFAISFSIISILTGVVTTYGTALGGGGPAALGIGWPIVCAGTMLVALAMAELASAFPTAGALYHWSALLGGPSWGWFTAMMNLVGQVAIVAAIDLGCAQSLVATTGWSPSSTLLVFTAILISHGVLNAFSVRLVAWLNDFSAAVHIVGVLVIVGALLFIGKSQPLSFAVKTGFSTRSDGNYTLGFLNALVLGMWTFTGYDASAHVSEETRDPARKAPRGIVSAVLVSAIAGYALVLALTLAIKDLPAAAADAQPPLYIMKTALGDRAGSAAMGLAILAMWFCGLSSVTSASRMIFAFARDGGIPASRFLARVHPTWKTPVIALAAAVLLPELLVLATSRFSDAVFLAVASLATTGLYVSYAIPILLGAIARRRGTWKKLGSWNLRSHGIWIAFAATLWSLFVLIVCSLPPNTTAGFMLVGVVVAIVILYFAFARNKFTGPKVTLAGFENASQNANDPA